MVRDADEMKRKPATTAGEAPLRVHERSFGPYRALKQEVGLSRAQFKLIAAFTASARAEVQKIIPSQLYHSQGTFGRIVVDLNGPSSTDIVSAAHWFSA
ncbi:hypothetical protein BH160DRAFT_2842 [Burkholderia sp. H160]|nr:hypothetical protein BH160DRAFT_2842 [Burkholderia sp. H160]